MVTLHDSRSRHPHPHSLTLLLHSLPALLVLAVAGVVVLLVPLPDRGALHHAGVTLLPALVAALVLARVGTATSEDRATFTTL